MLIYESLIEHECWHLKVFMENYIKVWPFALLCAGCSNFATFSRFYGCLHKPSSSSTQIIPIGLLDGYCMFCFKMAEFANSLRFYGGLNKPSFCSIRITCMVLPGWSLCVLFKGSWIPWEFLKVPINYHPVTFRLPAWYYLDGYCVLFKDNRVCEFLEILWRSLKTIILFHSDYLHGITRIVTVCFVLTLPVRRGGGGRGRDDPRKGFLSITSLPNVF